MWTRSLALAASRLNVGAAVKQLARRPPVVTIMGHVDHGKTTLLDQLRKSHIVEQEFGGITQHIGAFVVPICKHGKRKKKGNQDGNWNPEGVVTFLDTPGHAAFASMRQRGANVTDIVVLVVAAEDGILDQTVESIGFAKRSRVPIIVALNKIDKFRGKERDLDTAVKIVTSDLRVHGLITESCGGDVQLVKISALANMGLDDLKEAIVALAETLELRADPDSPAEGTIIESSLHPHRGQLCTILVQNGTVRRGDIIVGGRHNWARVRAMFDEHGRILNECRPGYPAQLIGWRTDKLPAAGDRFYQVDSERSARTIVAEAHNEETRAKALADAQEAARRAEEHQRIYREKLIKKRDSGFLYGQTLRKRGVLREPETQRSAMDQKRTLNLVIKADVNGSLEAILNLLDTYDRSGRQPIKLVVVHYGVGPINENDYTMAANFGENSIIYGFNVKFANQQLAARVRKPNSQVPVKIFNVIYHLFDDLRDTIVTRMPPVEQESECGSALVLQEFVVTDGKMQVHVAGARCHRGLLKRDAYYRVMRNGETILDRIKIRTMRHLKENITVINKEQECGLSFEDQENFTFRTGDQIICYEINMVKPKLKWDPKGFTTS